MYAAVGCLRCTKRHRWGASVLAILGLSTGGKSSSYSDAAHAHWNICHRHNTIWQLAVLKMQNASQLHSRPACPLSCCLQEAVCQCSEEFGPVQQVITATIPQNPTAIHLFNTLGFQHTHTVDMWPSYDALSQYEQTVGWKYTGVPPTTQELQEQLNMVDVLGVCMVISKIEYNYRSWRSFWCKALRACRHRALRYPPPIAYHLACTEG